MNMKKKLASKAGETIVEALAATLILLMGFMIVAGATSAAARANESIKNDEVAMNVADASTQNATVTVSMTGMEKTTTATVKLHKTESGYYYYDVTEFTVDEDEP